MKNLVDMYAFSSKLWYDKRWISKTGEASLYLQVVVNGKHKEFPLKLKWPSELIDLERGLLLPRKKKDNEANDFNLLIAIEQSKHTEILRTYRIKNAPIDIKTFTNEAKIFDLKATFTGYMYREIEKRFARKEITKRTFLNHNNALNMMIKFQSVWRFDQLTTGLMRHFKIWLTAQKYSPGHVWTTVKTVKCYLKFAQLEPMLHVDDAVVAFPNPMPTWKTVFLNKHELRRLMMVYQNRNITEKEERVLRAFLFTCFTSLRISDLYRVNAQWRMSDQFLDFIPKKNEKKRKWVHVPIMPMANQFIQNATGIYFKLPNEAEYNLTLKDLAKDAGIKKKLTSHVGRHTFGHLYMTTAANLKGLQEIMGHTKIETTMRYAHLDDEYTYESVKGIQEQFSDLLMRKAE